jgi:putative methionine-R-sulfoxide reductase with GAF domain
MCALSAVHLAANHYLGILHRDSALGIVHENNQNDDSQCSDVHQHCNHIACDLASASELVLPIRVNGELFALLDMDSPVTNHFDEEDLTGLTPVADAIGRWISQIGE